MAGEVETRWAAFLAPLAEVGVSGGCQFGLLLRCMIRGNHMHPLLLCMAKPQKTACPCGDVPVLRVWSIARSRLC